MTMNKDAINDAALVLAVRLRERSAFVELTVNEIQRVTVQWIVDCINANNATIPPHNEDK